MGDEVSKLWKIIGQLEGNVKPTLASNDDPASYGELAKAMNAMLHENEATKGLATSTSPAIEKRLMALEYDVRQGSKKVK